MKHDFIENELIILTKSVLDLFLKQKNPSQLIALYSFYYYTAKWQKTNQPKAVISYVAKGLHWGEDTVRKYKAELVKLGLIEDIREIDKETKQVTGWYIKVKYIFSQSHTVDFPEGGGGQRVDLKGTNALSTNNINALSTDNNIHTLNFEEFWKLYPRHEDKKKAETRWNNLSLEVRKRILEDIPRRKKSERWRDKQYIPFPTTYLNGERWEDEIEIKKSKSIIINKDGSYQN